MSGALFAGIAFGGLGAAASNLLETVLLVRQRQLGPASRGDFSKIIIPDCAIEEMHRDRMTITNHPVEQGAAITDHAYSEPAEVMLRYGWSNSSPANALISGFGLIGNFNPAGEDYVKDVYTLLRGLKDTRDPFDLVTGKRRYSNMLMTELSVTTDSHSEFTLIANIVCKQVILVSTAAATMAPASQQARPESTNEVQDTGPIQPTKVTPAPSSVLDDIFG